jgi:hypothetical protein
MARRARERTLEMHTADQRAIDFEEACSATSIPRRQEAEVLS